MPCAVAAEAEICSPTSSETGPESPAQNRVMEALGTDADILAVSCPTCAVMLGDAVKSTNLDERIQVGKYRKSSTTG